MPKRAINIGDARKLSDRELINGLLLDTTSAARYRQVLTERLQKDKYTDLYFWNLDGPDPRPPRRSTSKKLDTLRQFVDTAEGDLLDAELTDYLVRYPFFGDDNPLDRPARCIEFCQDKGRRSRDNIYGKTWEELSGAQRGLLGAIRAHADAWLARERRKGKR